ncbi:MAG: hypothetical protein R2761_06340 [Acidimicrobiales bacterium]
MSGEISGPLVVRARCGIDGVVVTWPERAGGAAALSEAVERFCRDASDDGPLAAGNRPELPPLHPHRPEVAAAALPTPGPIPSVVLVELTMIAGPGDTGAPLIVTVFVLTAGPHGTPNPFGPARPWSEFRHALLHEAVARRPIDNA